MKVKTAELEIQTLHLITWQGDNLRAVHDEVEPPMHGRTCSWIDWFLIVLPWSRLIIGLIFPIEKKGQFGFPLTKSPTRILYRPFKYLGRVKLLRHISSCVLYDYITIICTSYTKYRSIKSIQSHVGWTWTGKSPFKNTYSWYCISELFMLREAVRKLGSLFHSRCDRVEKKGRG